VKARAGLPAAGLAALALVPAAASADGRSEVIGRGTQLEGTRIWYVQGKARAPRGISARVVPVPPQRVKVQWSVVCQKSNPDDPAVHLGTKGASGETTVRAAATVNLALPYAKPPHCVATVYATLGARGKLTLRLLET
jgi:hypothetical protein